MPRVRTYCAWLTSIVTALAICDTDAAIFVQGGISGTTTIDDTSVHSDPNGQSISYGSDSRLYAGQVFGDLISRPLIRFDLSSLANQYAQITKIELTMGVNYSYGTTISLHEVNAINGNWTESDATWLSRNGVASWDGGPGLGTTGYGSLLTSQSIANGQTSVTWTISDAVMATTLVDHFTTGNNEGFLLKSTDETVYGYVEFASAEWATTSVRPTLTITYTVPEPSTAGLIGCMAPLVGFWRRRA